MNIEVNENSSFSKSLTIRIPQGAGVVKPLVLTVHANDKNPHWHDCVDKWSEEWCCIIHKGDKDYGVYGPIDPSSGINITDGVYIVVFRGGPFFYHEVQRIYNIEILSVDN